MSKITKEYIPEVGENYPCGPCEYPKKCICGKVLTKDNVVFDECEMDEVDYCEVCSYCSTAKCPECGRHTCCGGCI